VSPYLTVVFSSSIRLEIEGMTYLGRKNMQMHTLQTYRLGIANFFQCEGQEYLMLLVSALISGVSYYP
jgi:hypothetical protein